MDGRDLRDADARHHPGGADRPRAHAHLDGIDARIDEGLSPLTGGDVAADDLHTREGGVPFEPSDHLQGEPSPAVGRVDHDDIDAGLGERPGPIPGVAPVADRRPHDEPPLLVLGRQGVLLGLDEVLDGDQTREATGVVDEGKLLDAMLGQQRLGVLARDAGGSGDEAPPRRHALAHGQRAPLLGRHEAQVAVGDDAQQVAVGVDDGQARDLVATAQLVELGDGGVRAHRDRVGDHARLGALDEPHLLGLLLDGQIAMEDAHSALTGHGDRHSGLGNGVHRRTQQGCGQ